MFKKIEKLDLLVLDEVGYVPLHKQGAELLFQVISMCYEKKSIMITTNLYGWQGDTKNIFQKVNFLVAKYSELFFKSSVIKPARIGNVA